MSFTPSANKAPIWKHFVFPNDSSVKLLSGKKTCVDCVELKCHIPVGRPT